MINRQERGELAPDLDPAAVLLVIIGAVTAAVALPQVIKAIFDIDPDNPDFEEHYSRQVKAVIARLRPDPPRSRAPR